MHLTLADFTIYMGPGSQRQKESEINILKYKMCYLALILYTSFSVLLLTLTHRNTCENFKMFYISTNCEIILRSECINYP